MTLLRASELGAALDTDLMTGGGTDDTAVLQAALDRAAGGSPVQLLLDGPARVSGLDVHGGTTIEGVAGAGLYLADGSDRAVIRNAHRSRDTVVDRHIVLQGLFVNGNRAGQTAPGSWGPQVDRQGAFKSGIEMFGVEHLTIADVTVWNQRSFGIWIATATHVTIRDVTVDGNFAPYPGTESPAVQRAYLDGFRSNLDGIHVNGPARHIVMERIRVRSEDDAIALNANDMMADDMTVADEMGPHIGQGPISDVVIRDVVLDDAIQGFRLLSSDQRIDRILIENVSGSIRHQMVLLSNFHHRAPGDFGAIRFRNISVDPLPSATWTEIYPDWLERNPEGEGDGQVDIPLFPLRARIDRLDLEAVSARLIDERPLIRLGNNAEVGELRAEFRIDDPEHRVQPLKLVPGSRLGRVELSVTSGSV